MKRNYKHLTGIDATLDIALMEYGLAWFADPEPDEIDFFYGIRTEGEDYAAFDNCQVKRDVDRRKEWNWVDDWSGIASYSGQSLEEFLKQDLTHFIHTMI